MSIAPRAQLKSLQNSCRVLSIQCTVVTAGGVPRTAEHLLRKERKRKMNTSTMERSLFVFHYLKSCAEFLQQEAPTEKQVLRREEPCSGNRPNRETPLTCRAWSFCTGSRVRDVSVAVPPPRTPLRHCWHHPTGLPLFRSVGVGTGHSRTVTRALPRSSWLPGSDGGWCH